MPPLSSHKKKRLQLLHVLVNARKIICTVKTARSCARPFLVLSRQTAHDIGEGGSADFNFGNVYAVGMEQGSMTRTIHLL